MNQNPWEQGASLPLDDGGLSVIFHQQALVDDDAIEAAYADGRECTVHLSYIKEGFTAPNRTTMYDLRGVGNVSLNTSQQSQHAKYLQRLASNATRIMVSFIPTVFHQLTGQYEGYVTKIVEINARTGQIIGETIFHGGLGIEASVKSIFSKVYGNVPRGESEAGAQISAGGEAVDA